jgi:membrane protease subunit (stomatin/prohibitin family)
VSPAGRRQKNVARKCGCFAGGSGRGFGAGRRQCVRDASAQQAAAAADQAAANASQTKTPQQRLKELQSLYDQGLISASDYEAAKKKILNQLTQ